MRINILENRKIGLLLNFLSISLIIMCLIFSIMASVSAFALHEKKSKYLDDQKISRETFSVNVEGNVNIQGLLYMDEDLKQKTDHSVPTVLMIHGINTRKEGNFHIIYQLIKYGYAVFSVELRGHGESGGLVTFIDKEPSDMQQVIDYIESNYGFVNSSHMGLVGLSYGGGVATVLQAIEERVYASVIYHPLSSVNRFLDRFPVQNLLGITPSIDRFQNIEDAYSSLSPENTENLLLLHGAEDNVILPEDSKDLYKQVDGEERKEIALEIRPGLGHGGNEHDDTSLKHLLVWLEHFYRDSSINITNREEEIKNIQLFENNLPGGSEFEDLLFYAMIVLGFGLFFLITPRLHRYRKKREHQIKNGGSQTNSQKETRYKRMLLGRIISYLGVAFLLSLILGFLNPSYIYGYFFIIPVLTIAILSLIPSPQHKNALEEWKSWSRNQLEFTGLSSLIILLPALLFVIIFNLNAEITSRSPIPFFNPTTLIYLSIGLSTVFVDYFLIRGWKLKHTFLLLILRPITVLFFYLFIPLAPFPEYGGMMLYYTIFLAIGLVCWIIHVMLFLSGKILTSKFTAAAICLLPFAIFLVNRFFRII